VDAFDWALEEAGVGHEIVVYSGAPHPFDRKQEGFASESEDAWNRVSPSSSATSDASVAQPP
jgi:carboxymethylenebutenolidase